MAAVSAAAVGLSMIAAPSAFASTAGGTNPSSGPENTNWLLEIPSSAYCSTATSQPDGDHVDTFVVNDAIVGQSNLGSLTFNNANYLPTYNGYQGVPLLESGGPNTEQSTNPPVTGTSGQVTSAMAGPYNWENYSGDYGSGDDLSQGVFDVGVACVTSSGAIDNDEFWYVQVTFSGTTEPFTWTSSVPGAQTPEVPYAVILPIAGAAALLGGGVVMRRRRRTPAAT